MKYALPAFAVLAAFLLSCNNDPSAPPPSKPIVETHTIRDVDYIKDRLFLIDDPSSFLGAFPYSVEVFLTVRPQDLVADPTILRFPAWAIVDSAADGQVIDAAVAQIHAHGGTEGALQQDFRLLQPGIDYSLLMTPDTVVVGIELKKPVPATELRSLAVRYRNQLDDVIGGTLGTSPDTLVLEMIKAPDPRPEGPFRSAWRLAMRNAYDLGFSTIDPATLTVRIEDVLNTTRTDFSHPDGSNVPYVQIFGLDRHGATASDPPDGRIDNFYLGWSDDLKRGIMWMPTSYGFAPPAERVQVWTNSAFEFSGPYLPQYETASRIYSELLNAVEEQDVHQYVIKATVTKPAP